MTGAINRLYGVDVLIGDKQPVPSPYGTAQRDAIASVIDGIVQELCRDINELRFTLDEIEKQILHSATDAKAKLNEHVGVSMCVRDEIAHMRRVVEDIKARAPER
jgi:hypothetical protein